MYLLVLNYLTFLGAHAAFDMSCDCGKREMDDIAEKDCAESARLQEENQGWTPGKFFYTFSHQLDKCN